MTTEDAATELDNVILKGSPEEFSNVMENNRDQFAARTPVHPDSPDHSVSCLFDLEFLKGKPPTTWTELRFSKEFVWAMDQVIEEAKLGARKYDVNWLVN